MCITEAIKFVINTQILAIWKKLILNNRDLLMDIKGTKNVTETCD